MASTHKPGSVQDIGTVRPQHVILAGSDWTASHAPAANVVASATRPQADNQKCNICTGLTVCLAAGAIAPAAINLTVRLIDGVAGGSRYLWQMTISLPAVAGAMNGVVRENVWIPGSPNQPMTLEFSASGGANTVESVSFEGTSV